MSVEQHPLENTKNWTKPLEQWGQLNNYNLGSLTIFRMFRYTNIQLNNVFLNNLLLDQMYISNSYPVKHWQVKQGHFWMLSYLNNESIESSQKPNNVVTWTIKYWTISIWQVVIWTATSWNDCCSDDWCSNNYCWHDICWNDCPVWSCKVVKGLRTLLDHPGLMVWIDCVAHWEGLS